MAYQRYLDRAVPVVTFPAPFIEPIWRAQIVLKLKSCSSALTPTQFLFHQFSDIKNTDRPYILRGDSINEPRVE